MLAPKLNRNGKSTTSKETNRVRKEEKWRPKRKSDLPSRSNRISGSNRNSGSNRISSKSSNTKRSSNAKQSANIHHDVNRINDEKRKPRNSRNARKCSFCSQCKTQVDGQKHKYCWNCGYPQSLNLSTKGAVDTSNQRTEQLNRSLTKLTQNRINLIAEYHKNCQLVDDQIIGFIHKQIGIESEYLSKQKKLISRYGAYAQNPSSNSNDKKARNIIPFELSSKLVLTAYIDTIRDTMTDHELFIQFLEKMLNYFSAEKKTLNGEMTRFQKEHEMALHHLFSRYRENENEFDQQGINEKEYGIKKSELWKEWKANRVKVAESFTDFVRKQYRIMVEEGMNKVVGNRMKRNYKVQRQYVKFWNHIQDSIQSDDEIKAFVTLHQEMAEQDTLESVMENMAFELRKGGDLNTKSGRGRRGWSEKERERMNRDERDILKKTRSNGLEWFSSLIFSAKGKKAWDQHPKGWKLLIFEQILYETFLVHSRWETKEELASYHPINYMRNQLEISRRKMNQLIDILMIDDSEYNKERRRYKINSLCHRIEVLDFLDLEVHFQGDGKDYDDFVDRQLSFILSSIVWYILESARNLWNVSGHKMNKSDLMQSLHSNMKMVRKFCKKKKTKKMEEINEKESGHKNDDSSSKEMGSPSSKTAMFSPTKHLMLLIQEIASDLNEDAMAMNFEVPNYVPVPNAIYMKIYIEVMRLCFLENKSQDFDQFMDTLLSDHDGDQHNEAKEEMEPLSGSRPRRQLYSYWTQIADLMHTLSQRTFGISIQFHCYAFLDLVFEEILVADPENRVLTQLQPRNTKSDRILLKVLEQTFCILMDQIEEDSRSPQMLNQEDPVIAVIVEKIESSLALILSDYQNCDALTVSKFFLFWILIKKIKQKDIGYTLHYDKLVEFTLITANQMSTDLKVKYCGDKSDEELAHRLDDIKLLNKFRIDFLRILHDQIKWHQTLDDYLKADIQRINTVDIERLNNGDGNQSPLEYVIINNFTNDHTETFLLMWMSRFSSLVDDKLQELKHQDINDHFLGMIDAVDKFIVISSQYKDRVSIKNKVRWAQSVPPLNKIVVFKFKHWIKTEVSLIFSRAVDTIIKNEDFNHENRRRSSLLLDARASEFMTTNLIESLEKSSSKIVPTVEHISDYILDLCTLTDSVTNACLSYMMSLRIHDFKDSKSYWKMLHKQFERISDWICKDVMKKISFLMPPIRILSRNVLEHDLNLEDSHASYWEYFKSNLHEDVRGDSEDDLQGREDIKKLIGTKQRRRNRKERQRRETMQLALKMHCVDFIMTSLDRTKKYIREEYVNFMRKEYFERTEEMLKREVIIKLRDANIFRFLSQNFTFIPLHFESQRGMVIFSISAPALEKQHEISIGFELIKIGHHICRGRLHNELLEWIQNEYNNICSEETEIVFRFNVDGVAETLFYPIYSRLNSNLKSLSRLLSMEIVFDHLHPVLFGKLYHDPIYETRWSNLNISEKFAKVCEPIFDLINDRNFSLIIRDLFDHLMFAIPYVLTETFHIDSKEWIRNDYKLIKDDIDAVIKSFEHDIDAEYIEDNTLRIRYLLEMIKSSTNHLTSRSLSFVQDVHAFCGNGHVLFECVVHPQFLNLLDSDALTVAMKDEERRSGKRKLVRCRRCRLYINIRYRLDKIGYYCCGDLSCINKDGMVYCGKCYNEMLCAQNTGTTDFEGISKRDVIAMLHKKKDMDHSKMFAVKYVQTQCIRTQLGPKEKVKDGNYGKRGGHWLGTELKKKIEKKLGDVM